MKNFIKLDNLISSNFIKAIQYIDKALASLKAIT
jgi:hypothetical protein